MDGRQPPKIVDVVFGGVEGVYAPQSAPLFRRWFIATTSECFEGHTHPQQPQKLYLLAWGVVAHLFDALEQSNRPMWGTRGPYTPAAAMVGYGCVGRCWQLEANIRLTYCRNSKNCQRKYFFYSYVDPIYSWHLTRQLNKEDLDLCTFAFSWFSCPGFNSSLLAGWA
jgi:hypothetical protein